jgi:hypothetical protein
MPDSEAGGLSRMAKAGICPNCGRQIEQGRAVVRGAGLFCSLECVASYHEAEFVERARRLAAATRN